MKASVRFVLQVCLFGPLALAFLYVHAYLSLQISGLSHLFDARPMKLTALLVSGLLSGLIPGMLFGYPFLRLYGRGAVLVSAIASVLVALLFFLLIGKVHLPFVIAAFALEIFALAISLPLCVWLIRNRFRDNSSRPMETPCAN